MKKYLIVMVAAFFLAACADSEKKQPSEQNQSSSTIGFEMMDGSIEEASNVPVDEKVKIIAAFDEYIASFNAKDIKRYGEILSKNPQGFDYDEEINFIKNTFENYDVKRVDSNVTIVKYDEKEAQVFANIDTETKDMETKEDYQYSGRQVTVFVNEDGEWKVSSVFYIGDQSDETEQGTQQ